MDKTYISPNELHHQSIVLSNDIIASVRRSDFNPTKLIALSRGGLGIGTSVHGALNRVGIHTEFHTARTSRYDKHGVPSKTVQVHGIEYIVKSSTPSDQFLLVDDIFDSGQSMKALIERLTEKLKKKHGSQYAFIFHIATVFWKPHKNTTDLKPHHFARITEEWIIFPSESDEMTTQEIHQHMPPKTAALFAMHDRPPAAEEAASSTMDETQRVTPPSIQIDQFDGRSGDSILLYDSTMAQAIDSSDDDIDNDDMASWN